MNKLKLIKIIQQGAEEFFDKMGFAVNLKVESEEDSTFNILVKMDDPQILIGKQGETLSLVQKLLIKIISKKLKKEDAERISNTPRGPKHPFRKEVSPEQS